MALPAILAAAPAIGSLLGSLFGKKSPATPPINPNAGGALSSGGGGGLMGILGGASGLLGGILNAAGPVGAAATGAARGQSDERQNQNLYNINTNNAQTQRYGIRQNALSDAANMQERGTMDRAGLKLAAPDKRASQVVRGSLMELLQPAKISHPRAVIPQMSGGLTPAALSDAVRQSGRDLQSIAGDALRTGSDVPEMPDFKANVLDAPDIAEYEDPSGTETALSTGGSIASLIAALAKQGQGDPNKKIVQPQPQTPTPPWDEMDPVSRAALGLPGRP
jgi:hypothetical protein